VEVQDQVLLPPVDTAADDPFVAIVCSASVPSDSTTPPIAPARYFTDASVLADVLDNGSAVPTVVLGPGEAAQCHVANEWCLAPRVEQAVEVYGALLARWCG
jgi:succinyl-diaminopimelate desuccinylase